MTPEPAAWLVLYDVSRGGRPCQRAFIRRVDAEKFAKKNRVASVHPLYLGAPPP